MIFNPTITGINNGGATPELVTIKTKFAPADLHLYYATVENGVVVCKHMQAAGETFQVIKGSVFLGITTRMYSTLLDLPMTTTIGNISELTYDQVSGFSEFSKNEHDEYCCRVYEATG